MKTGTCAEWAGVRATVRAITRAAPARRRTRLQASSVAPVVITSSTSRIRSLSTWAPGRVAKAPLAALQRWLRVSLKTPAAAVSEPGCCFAPVAQAGAPGDARSARPGYSRARGGVPGAKAREQSGRRRKSAGLRATTSATLRGKPCSQRGYAPVLQQQDGPDHGRVIERITTSNIKIIGFRAAEPAENRGRFANVRGRESGGHTGSTTARRAQ